jgi:hypothetical protein
MCGDSFRDVEQVGATRRSKITERISVVGRLSTEKAKFRTGPVGRIATGF